MVDLPACRRRLYRGRAVCDPDCFGGAYAVKSGEPYSAEDDNRLVRLREAGRSFGEIGYSIGRSPDSARKRYNFLLKEMHRTDAEPKERFTRGYSPEEDLLILTYRRHGLTFSEIARRIKRHKEGVANRYYKLNDMPPIPRPLTEVRADRETLERQCELHAEAVMDEGGFCAFSDNGNKSTGLGICLPMIWPERR